MKPKRLSGSTGKNTGPRDYRSIQEGTPVAFPVVTRDGKIAIQIDPFGAIGVDPARGQFVRVGGGLAVEQGSPYRIVPVLGAGVEINDKGEIVPSLSSSVRLNARNKLVATPSTSEVTDPTDGTAAAALGRVANELSALDTRIDVLEAGFGDFAHPGTTEYEAWFAANCATHTAFSAQALVANRLYAMPLVAAKRTGVALDRLGINVTTGSAGAARLGIYNDSNGYPGSLLLDAGTVDVTSIAVVTTTIAQALTPGGRYWYVYVSNATPTVRSIPVNCCSHALGFSSSLGTAGNCGLYVAYVYAALPDPFPSTPTMITANPIPALFYRYSA